MKKILVVIGVLLLLAVFLSGCNDLTGYPPSGYSYDSDITTDFYEQYYPEGWAGIGYKVWVKDGETPSTGGYYIKLYSAGTVPNPEYELDGEGTYNAGVFYWDWIDIPWD